MSVPKTQSHFLPSGMLCHKAPLTYYIGEADSRGLMNMKLENAGKKFLCIEVKEG